MKLADEITALERLTVPELRGRYAELFGEATRVGHKVWLIKRIAWRLQALAEGDLSERARQRALELANDADLRVLAPKPPRRAASASPQPRAEGAPGAAPAMRDARAADESPALVDTRLPLPGAVLTRLYKGQRVEVTVLDGGFAFAGKLYRSLSAVAKTVTGTHTNGFLFFRLRGKEATQ